MRCVTFNNFILMISHQIHDINILHPSILFPMQALTYIEMDWKQFMLDGEVIVSKTRKNYFREQIPLSLG